MRKVLFLLLFLVILGAAGISAQVRIGGDEAPNEAAVLDLNVDDATDAGTKGLALPRVSLASNDDKLGYSDLLEGMLVYNTNADITGGDGVGVYYWDGSKWIKSAGAGSTSVVLSGNSFQRAALSGDVTATQNDNTVTINAGAVSLAKTTIKKVTVPITDLLLPAGSTTTVAYPAGCTSTNSWLTYFCGGYCNVVSSTTVVGFRRVVTAATATPDVVTFWCFV